jgi:nondiscriminating glutamyl-tRNA synthetase
LELYNQYVQQLLDTDRAYYARETAEELEQMRKGAYARKQAFNYRRQAYTDEQIAQFKAEGRKPVIRFALPVDQEVKFVDQIKGETSFEMKQFGDFVIVKSDGVPTYYLANVIDDHLQEITHVVRGEEHLSNTPKQIALYQAFGRESPIFAHLPLMLNPSGKKMSKRDKGIGLTLVPQFRDGGFLPEAVVNFIALLGRNPGDEREFFTLQELVETFSIERVQKANAVYDFKRALWFNGEYIKRLSDEQFVTKTKDYLYLYAGEEWKEIIESVDDSYWLKLAPYIKVRLQTLAQFKQYCQYFFVRLPVDEELVVRQKMKITSELV